MISVKVGKLELGEGQELLFVAELGTCYDGDVETAKLLLRKASEAGAQLAKLECFIPEDVYRLKEMARATITFATADGPTESDYLTHLRTKVMSLSQYEEIFRYSAEIGLPCFATVYDLEMMRRIKSFGAVAAKIASCNAIHLPLIEEAGKLELPLFLDTNHSLLDTLAQAVYTAEGASVPGMILMHNPIGPRPTPPELHHFLVMQSYKEIFDIPVGFTCHYRGDEMMIAAAALGANVIEKPISLDPETRDNEYVYSIQIDKFKDVIRQCRNASLARGKARLDQTDMPQFVLERMSPCANTEIRKGERLSLANVSFKRPCSEITPEFWRQMANRRVQVDLEPDQLIEWGHLECDS